VLYALIDLILTEFLPGPDLSIGQIFKTWKSRILPLASKTVLLSAPILKVVEVLDPRPSLCAMDWLTYLLQTKLRLIADISNWEWDLHTPIGRISLCLKGEGIEEFCNYYAVWLRVSCTQSGNNNGIESESTSREWEFHEKHRAECEIISGPSWPIQPRIYAKLQGQVVQFEIDHMVSPSQIALTLTQ